MRVIAGTAKGTKLKAPSGSSVRPTADRVKEALFSILGSRIIGADFIDFYAGSGAVGIEALSRGAESCTFVENSKKNILFIKDNLTKTKLENRSRVICADVKKALRRLEGEAVRGEIVFLDPPYLIPDLHLIVGPLLYSAVINDCGLIIVEHAWKNRKWLDKLPLTKQKKYGDTCLSFFELRREEFLPKI